MLVAPVVDASVRSPAPGAVIGDRFRLEAELGVGGMGTVYRAVDLQTGAAVALKLMRRELADDPRATERFRREGAALAAVQHPAVVQIREVGGLDDGTLYLAMELLEGETLGERLAREGRMSPQALLPLVLALADGLAAAHAGGIIHRDLKPSNVFLCRDTAKLVDFGVARVRGFDRMTSSGLAVGTIRYMAPEQLGGGAVDERVDVYSLGVSMYEALAGEHPFARTAGDDPIGAILVGRATPLSTLRPDLPPAITRVVHRAMARLPTERFGSARALGEAFRRAVLEPERAPFDDAPTPLPDETREAYADPRSDPRALAPTELAIPRARAEAPAPDRSTPDRSTVRRKGRLGPPVWLLLPLLVGACLIPGLGLAGFVGCGSWMTDVQLEVAVESVRTAIELAPDELAHHRVELDRLEALHEREQVNLFAAAAFNARVQEVTQAHGRVRPADVGWIMEVVRDINARGGEYTLEHYSEMTEGAQRSSTPAGSPASSAP